MFGAHFVPLLEHKKVGVFSFVWPPQCKIVTFSDPENDFFVTKITSKNMFLMILSVQKMSSRGDFWGTPKRGHKSWVCIAKTRSQVIHVLPTFHDFWSSWGSKKSSFCDIFYSSKTIKICIPREQKTSISGAKRKNIIK